MTSSMLLFYFTLGLLFWTIDALPVPFGGPIRSFDMPFQRRARGSARLQGRDHVSGSTGLGDNSDLLYSVPIELGSTTTAVHLDTGSSDLWVVSDKCTAGTCTSVTAARYPSSSLNSSGADVVMKYGDSTTGTQASGQVGYEVATIAGVAIQGQAFGLIDTTDNPTVQFDTAGILGLGFPSGSEIQEAAVVKTSGEIDTTDAFVQSTYTDGPLLSRIAMTGALEAPMFSVSLQRNTIDIGGGTGMLTVGKLPDGVDNSSLTWVPVRLYSVDDGGLRAPTFAPSENYPLRWEIDIDAVFLDGNKVADSTLAASDGVDASRVSALIDTGNSLLRGPKDVVDTVLSTVSPSYDATAANAEAIVPCATAHNLAFQIGGKMFPIDPRDFISPGDSGTANCKADNLVSTDPPRFGALFRWSLGDPFMKSNLVAFHYGNLTHPSVDPPRVGLLSMVPVDADAQLTKAVQDAQQGGFESTLEAAPTASAAAEGQVTVVPEIAGATTSIGRMDNQAGAPTTTLSLTAPSGNISAQNSGVSLSVPRSFASLSIVHVILVVSCFGFL